MTNEKDIARIIVEEVCRRINSADNDKTRQTVLALFCGGLRGAEESIASLNACKKFCSVKAVLTPCAEKVIGKERIRTELGPDEIYTDESGKNEIELIDQADLLVIPVLTKSTAAKAVCGIGDNLVTNLIMQALLRSKPIIAVRDACDISRSSSANPVYRARLSGNIRQLEQYGITFTNAADLGDMIKSHFGHTGIVLSSETGENQPELTFAGKILTRTDVASWKLPLIKLQPGTLITPSARDAADERGIKIQRISE